MAPPTRPPGPTAPDHSELPDAFFLSFTVEPDLAEGVLTLAEEWAAGHGAAKDDRTSLRIVLEELLLNLCLHGGRSAGNKDPQAELTITPVYAPAEAQSPPEATAPRLCRLAVTLRDTGPEFNPLLYESEPIGTIRSTRPGGRGLTLVRLLSVDLEYTRRHGSNSIKLALVCNRPGGTSSSAAAVPGKAHSEAAGPGGIFRAARRVWSGALAARHTVFFFCISCVMLWGGLLFYYLAASDSRQESGRKLCTQALHAQNVSSSTFLARLAGSFAEFTRGIAGRPDRKALLDNDDAFFNELRDGVLLRTVTADTAVLGVLRGEKGKPGAMLLYRTTDAVRRKFLPMNFDPLVEKSVAGGSPEWVGPIRELSEEAGQGHAGMLIGTIMPREDGAREDDKEVWVGLVLTMPWIAATLDALSGFDNVASAFVTAQGEYTVYPPGRSVHGGPQRLRDEAGASPEMRRLLKDIANRATGMLPLESLFPGGGPWPLPWSGETTLAHAPMDIPGWSFLLLVSSGEIRVTPPPLPLFMIGLAGLAPFLIALIAWKVSSTAVRPLGRLAEALDRITDGDLDTPLPTAAVRDEIGGMLLAFEHVRVTLKQSFANLVAATAAEQRVRNELTLARAIQESMLPVSPPDVPGIRVATSIDMASDVCGDLFDCFTLPDAPEALYCLIGDVCGKGIPASVIMSRAMVLARSLLLSGKAPAETLSRLNEALLRFNDSLMFVTLLVARLDGMTGAFTWAAAGHPPPMLGPAALRETPPTVGPLPWSRELPLGVKAGVSYTEHTVTMAPGQSLLLYTDGADEAMAPATGTTVPPPGRSEGLEIFGEERLQSVFFNACGHDENSCLPQPADVLTHVRESLIAHMGGRGPFDDMSLIVIRWDGTTNPLPPAARGRLCPPLDTPRQGRPPLDPANGVATLSADQKTYRTFRGRRSQNRA